MGYGVAIYIEACNYVLDMFGWIQGYGCQTRVSLLQVRVAVVFADTVSGLSELVD